MPVNYKENYNKLKILDFSNTQQAFSQKSDAELRRSYLLFKALSLPFLVKLGPFLTKLALLLKLPIRGLIRKTIFGQFCGGETIEECQKVVNKLDKVQVGTILDFATEASQREKDFNRVQDEILATIDLSAAHSAIPFAVFKPSGIGPGDVLEKRDRKLPLSNAEQQKFQAFAQRFEKVCRHAWEKQVRIFVDAEESWIQDSVDQLTRKMMMQFNKEKAIVFNTIQLYRKDRLDFLKRSYGDASAHGYFLGVKLVRGAYLEKEAIKAAELGYANPLHASKEATDQDYNLALRFCVEKIERIATCAGTHNEKSTRLLINLLNEFKIDKNDSRIYFAQLLGMSDHLTFNLAHHGYNVCKYVPYGKLHELLPYLSRRAEENSSIRGQTGRELAMIQTELERRNQVKQSHL